MRGRLRWGRGGLIRRRRHFDRCQAVSLFRLNNSTSHSRAVSPPPPVMLSRIRVALISSNVTFQSNRLLPATLAHCAGPLAAAGWMWAPTFPFHDYRPFSMVRRVTLEKGDDPPINALNVSKALPDGKIRYLVPWAHSFLNMASLEEERTGKDYTPFVFRATTLYWDAKMEDERSWVSAKPDVWSKIKSLSLLGLVGIEFIVMFLMFTVMNG